MDNNNDSWDDQDLGAGLDFGSLADLQKLIALPN